jgi:hypothetical protein
MALICLAPPMVEPVTVLEMKEYLRLDSGDNSQDNLIYDLITAARAWAEDFTEKKFVKQQWRLAIDFFPGYVNLKLVGEKISSPFVSGSNAVLVGIRYAIMLPYPPVFSIDKFIYQNAAGQTTSMISAPQTISAITNPLGGNLGLTTAAPHGFQSAMSVTIAGTAALIQLLGQTTEVITVTGPSDVTLNGTFGTGVGIAPGGTITGYNYVQDVFSNPARVMPIFGQMWPVARIVSNAVQLDYTCGFAQSIQVTTGGGSPPNPSQITAQGYSFQATDLGRPISIQGAGINAATLNTIIATVNTDGTAIVRDPPQTAVTSPATTLLVNAPYGNPNHWAAIRLGIKMLTERWYELRIPDECEVPLAVKSVLYPIRDLRF